MVFPGVDEVCASLLLLHNIFISDDFPTFDLPMNANSGNFSAGLSFKNWQLCLNISFSICIIYFLQSYNSMMDLTKKIGDLTKNLYIEPTYNGSIRWKK